MEQYHSGIPLEEIPPVIMDVFAIIRGLGVRFLWVDRACIVQDDQEDKSIMLNEIPSIYTNSYLNIVVAARPGSVSLQPAHTDASRFPNYRFKDRLTDVTIKWPASEAFYNMCGLNPEYYPNSFHFISPPQLPAWILQETRSVPRNLVFQAREDFLRTEQVYLRCEERVVWESGLERCVTLSDRDEHSNWYRTVELFSSFRLTVPSDRLIALNGLARISAKAFGGNYAAGLWVTDSIRGLLWYRLQPSQFNDRNDRKHAPTWSWASGEGRCVHYWPQHVVSTARVVGAREHAHEMGFGQPSERFGGYVGCVSLVIKAPMLRIDWSCCTKAPFEYTYDISCDQFNDRSSPLRVSCWFDTEAWTPNTPGSHIKPIFMLQLTRRAGLLLRRQEIDLDVDKKMEKEKFVRVGLFVVAKSAGHPFESAETHQVTIE